MKIVYRPLPVTEGVPMWSCDWCGGSVVDRGVHAGWHRRNEGRATGDASARGPAHYTVEPPLSWTTEGTAPVAGGGHYGAVLSKEQAASAGLLLDPEDYAAQAYGAGFRDGESARRQAFAAGVLPDAVLDVRVDAETPGPVTVDDVARQVERGLAREAARREAPEVVLMDGSRPFPVPVHAVPKYGDVVDTYMEGVAQALDDGEEQRPE